MLDKTELIASVHLGKKSAGSEFYDPSLLVPIPRIENRRQYGIENEALPFVGFDIWQAYEFSTLTKHGLPLTRVLKIKYSCNSEFLVESKSLKLYLNSFNMSRFGNNIQEALDITKKMIEKDLSDVLKTKVEVSFLDNKSKQVSIFSEFEDIMKFVDEDSIQVDNYKENPDYLILKETEYEKKYYLTFDSLRSNCRVTHQPDFGDAFIYYRSKKHIEESSIVKYLSSFRSEYHFHEECVEMIFKRLQDLLDANDELFVCALYTRRGGIDISPIRWNKQCKENFAEDLLNTVLFARNGIKQ